MQPFIADFIFFVFAAITVLGAFMAVGLKNIFHNALALALTLLGTAGIFVFLSSEFLALMQVLIYAGAISIAIIFAIMLSPPLAHKPVKRSMGKILISLVTSALILCALSYTFIKAPWPVSAAGEGDYSVAHLGQVLVERYAFAFELISVVLLVAILGAIVIAREEKKNEVVC
ncbi:MAG: NADH-quinone oxidoreductase subunit J [Candidatus Omnitrophica bacterium]|nr:NADH-quinone oxidoreductase subunit J [Candidatus Omnitrophota bacterium]